MLYVDIVRQAVCHTCSHVFTNNSYPSVLSHSLFSHPTAQILVQPPESTTAALGANATFSCGGDGTVLWQINNTQVQDGSQVPSFANIQVFVPLPRDGFSELIVTATRVTNATLVIICAVDPGVGTGDLVRSDPVQLLVYGRYLYVCTTRISWSH